MEKKLFNQLAAGVREMKAVMRGEQKPARATRVESRPPAVIRHNMKLLQKEFAQLLGISEQTLQNWKQGHRHPTGPAEVLLKIAAKHPDIIPKAVNERVLFSPAKASQRWKFAAFAIQRFTARPLFSLNNKNYIALIAIV